MSKAPFVILADDATGAMDAGMQMLACAGIIHVQLDPAARPGRSDVLVYDADTRNCDPQTAAHITRELKTHIDYKKIDSTMRGNIGAELGALHETGRWDAFVVCPALPESGRTTAQGIHYVNGVPLAQTEFASDPFSPIATSDIREIVGRDLPLIVPDATTRADLDAIAREYQGSERVLLCGSAGLLASMRLSLGDPHSRPLPPPPTGAPQLILNGSTARATKRQINHLLIHNGGVVRSMPRLELLGSEGWRAERMRVLVEVCGALEDGRHVVLDVAAQSRQELAALDPNTLRRHSGEVQRLLMNAAEYAAGEYELGALHIIGGDTLRNVGIALSADAIGIAGQALPLIPVGWFANGIATDLPITTKAGGFGEIDALTRLVERMGG